MVIHRFYLTQPKAFMHALRADCRRLTPTTSQHYIILATIRGCIMRTMQFVIDSVLTLPVGSLAAARFGASDG